MFFNEQRQCQNRIFRRNNFFIYSRIIILIVCVAMLPSVAVAVVSTGIYFEIIPPAPSTADDIKIKTYFPGGPFIVTHSHSVIDNQITVVLLMDGIDFSPNPPHDFTEDIGKLTSGEYQVTIYVRRSTTNPVPFDILYGSFSVGHPVTVPTLNEYSMLIMFLSFAGCSLYFLKRTS